MASKFPQGSGFSNFHEKLLKKTPPKKRLKEKNRQRVSGPVPRQCLVFWPKANTPCQKVPGMATLGFKKFELLPFITFATQKNKSRYCKIRKHWKVGWSMSIHWASYIVACFLLFGLNVLQPPLITSQVAKKKQKINRKTRFFVHVFPPNSRRSNLG